MKTKVVFLFHYTAVVVMQSGTETGHRNQQNQQVRNGNMFFFSVVA